MQPARIAADDPQARIIFWYERRSAASVAANFPKQ